ncbi:hypothetical protein M409DRAFT_67411 [Zasmidium cellare ATCC 36951]|uniref:tyrosinase n=1 Tax=Zasmidium cellare ATCC 36951 TaxID=1080233 RepID=A0A6A6CD45_ZASCE|nr:uncharacterized protein M409DRAFT_67411 [Zasmidium cellare ATCC 36951]KAF2165127.1 hypothetical protein M409DRAFT_67411 [Zasmidium cellare ATCC 36951]
MLLTTAISSLALISSVAAHGLQHEHLHKRQQAGPVYITGAKGFGDNQVHTRLEVSDLAANRPDQWTLFVGAMRRWMDGNTANSTSYYQVAGVHGVPRTSWNGVEQCSSCGDADGYCCHDSVLFPAWHRAYMALYEQEFLKIACELAGEYTGTKRQTMVDACSTMRFPYWDWAAKAESGDVFPAFLSSPQIVVDLPAGQQTIDNPLYTYKLPDPSAMYYSPFTTWPETLRYPNSNNADGTSQETSAVNAFNNIQGSMQDQVYNLMGCDDYLHFSNDASGSTEKCGNSLEGIHNTIHTTSGGPGSNGVSGGHMTYLPLAAFDAIFWLHHCNVDRLFALWQTINPDSYGASQVAPHNTWTIQSGSTQNAGSPLTPFRKDSSSFWTTDEVRDWKTTFSYTYPEFSTSDGTKASIVNFVNSLYGPNANLTAASISKNAETDSAGNSGRALEPSTGSSSSSASSTSAASSTSSSASASSSSSAVSSSVSSPPPFNANNATATATSGRAFPTGGFQNFTVPNNSSFNAPNGSTYQYTCHVQTPRYTLNGSYIVYVFDSPAKSNDSSTWLGDEGCAGIIGVLAGGEMANPDVHLSGAIPLTTHLQKRVEQGKLPSMAEKNAVPYLTKNLHWRIAREGKEINIQNVPTFNAAVFSGTSNKPSEGSLGTWNSYVPQVEVTKGKAGGAKVAPSYASGGSGSGSSSSAPCPEESSPASPVESGPAAPPYPAANGTVPAYQPTGATGTGAYSPPAATSPGSPAPYTGAASKASFGFAGLAVVAGLVAAL